MRVEVSVNILVNNTPNIFKPLVFKTDIDTKGFLLELDGSYRMVAGIEMEFDSLVRNKVKEYASKMESVKFLCGNVGYKGYTIEFLE